MTVLRKRFRKAGGGGLKDLVNAALRGGLKHMALSPKKRTPFQARSVDLGRCLVGNVYNVAEVLANAGPPGSTRN